MELSFSKKEIGKASGPRFPMESTAPALRSIEMLASRARLAER